MSASTHPNGQRAGAPSHALRNVFSLLMLVWVASCAGRPPATAPQPLPETPPPPRAWSTAQLADLRAVAVEAPAHGLRPDSDALEQLDRLEPLSLRDAEAARRLDATAGQLFESLALAFGMGAIEPTQADPEWRIAAPLAPDLAAVRRRVAEGGDVSDTLAALLPTTREYAGLVAELARVRAEADGAADADGVSKEARIARLHATLERWRWLPRNLPARRVDVLVPFYELRLRDGDASTSHAIIVGARRTRTPSFSAAIEAITLNPTWTPPSSILLGELLPRFRRNPDAAAREGFDAIDSAGRVVDPAAVNWRARPFLYTLRQRAGASNALGRLRFDLPNPYAVFLHDTPGRALFARNDRALSHGCIRVSEPVPLAANVLADPLWDEAALNAAINTGATQVIALGAPLPVYVLYLTAAPDQDGVVRYADDIYGKDTDVMRALDQERPTQRVAAAVPETALLGNALGRRNCLS